MKKQSHRRDLFKITQLDGDRAGIQTDLEVLCLQSPCLLLQPVEVQQTEEPGTVNLDISHAEREWHLDDTC